MNDFKMIQNRLPGVPALTPKQSRLVDEYMVDLNAQAALRRAGYSRSSPRDQSPLHSPAVRAAIEARVRDLRARNEHLVDRVVEELCRIAFADLRDAVEWGPDGVRVRPSRDLTPELTSAVCEVSEDRHGRVRLKKHDKVRALELLGRHLGMFTERLQAEVSGPGGLPLREDRRILVQFVEAGGRDAEGDPDSRSASEGRGSAKRERAA